MRLLVVIVAFCLYGVALWSQEVTSNHYVIEVNQRFNSSNHCDGGYPSLSKATFTIYKDDSTLKKEECEGVRHSDSHFTAKTSFNLDKDSYNTFTSIEFYDETRGIGRKGNTFTDSKTIQKSDLHVGENIITPNCEGSAKCSPLHTESYTIHTSIIIDNPVEIIPKKDNSSLCIDDGDKCEFRLNNFYVTANTEFYFSVKLTSEDDKSWRKTTRTFKPNQEIALSYDEIRSIAGITDEFAWSGKNISIKITKKLIDGSWTESNVVLCKFIHNGPNFEVKTVRRSYCSDAVKLQVVSENLSSYSNSRFNWEVAQMDENAKNLKQYSVNEFKRTTTPNLYDLSINDVDFATDVFEDENNPEGSKYHWFLQLQEKDSSTLKFTTKEFEIAPRAPQITISQYPDEGTEEVESGLDPYIRIKIEDLDTYYENGRVPYKVYEVDESGEKHYLTEFNNRIDATEFNEEELKNDFNSDNPDHSLDITESSYIQNKFHEWYENEKKGLAVKTIKVSGILPNQSDVGKVTESANVMCVNGSTLYFYDEAWYKIQFNNEKKPISDNDKKETTINRNTYTINDISAIDFISGFTKEYITQASNFIVFSTSDLSNSYNNFIHAIFFDGSSKVKRITSDRGELTTSYIARKIWNKPCLLHCKKGSTLLTCYINGESTQFDLYSGLDAVGATCINEDSSVVYISDSQTYKRQNTPFSESDLYEYFKKDQAVIPSTQFDSEWEEFREKRNALYANFLAEKLSYRVSGMKHYTIDSEDEDIVNCSGNLKVQDVDSCYSNVIDYKFQYRKVKFDIEVSTYPSTLSANDGVVKLTLDEGGLAPYTINGDSLIKNKCVEIDGCGYGKTKVTVKDGNGVEFDYTINIPLPKHTIECKPQTCSGGGGKIVVICEGNDLKLKSYILKRNGDVYRKIKSTSNSDTYTFAELDLGDYEVCGEFDNGDQILLSEKETIVDESLSVDVTIVDAKEINQGGTVTLESKNAQGNVVWQEITENGEIEIDGKGSPISIKDVSIGRHEYRVSDSQVCSASKTVEVFGPEISMDVDIEAKENSAYIRIEDIKSQNISDYHFEVNGQKIENFSKVPYDKTQTFTFDLKYQTTPQGEVYTYNIIDQKLNSGTISISDASDKERCSGTDGQLKIVAEDIPENVKCYYQIANVSEEETELTNGTHDVSASIGEKVVYVRQEQTFSKGQINVNIHHDSQYSVNIADGTPTDAIVIAHDVKCHGANDGYIEIVSKSGESLNNVWLCQDVATLENTDVKKTRISSLQPGEYYYYVVDGRCPSLAQKDTSTIQSPSEKLRIENMVIISSPTCHENDGKIELEIKGGWGDYIQINDYVEFEKDKESYLEDKEKKNSGLFFLDKLSSGKQHFVIVDKLLCELHIDTILPEYTSPQIINAAGEQTSCYGNADGKITIDSVKTDCTVENSPLSLIIRDSSDTISISNPYQTVIEQLSKGSYELKIIDKNKCTSEPYFVTITEPEPVKVEAYVLNDAKITYKGGDDGKMNIIVSGGNEGLKTIYYGDTSICLPTNVLYSVEGLRAGMIDISATDKKGCSSNMVQVTFDEPKQALSIETETEPALCHAMTGAVKVKAEGGWGDYIIKLVGEREERNITEQKEVTFEGLSAGDYELTVTDERGAKIRQTVRVNAPEPIDHTLIITPDQCEGNGVGEITLSGGTPEYRSLFNMETDTIRGGKITLDYLKGGRDYTLTTWDANRCESKMTFSVPDEQLKAEIKHEYNNDGVLLTADVTGGVKPITYNWYNKSKEEEVGTTSQITVNQSGLYLLEVTDISGCMRSVMKSVLMSGSLSMRVKSVKRATNIANDNGMAEIICHATQSPNVRLYHLESDTWKTDISMSNDTVIILRGLQSGHYYVEGNLGNGNIQTTEFTIEPYKEMELLSLNIKHVSEPNKNDARVVAYIEGGIAPYKVEGTYFATKYIELNGIKSGLYTMTIADSTGNKFTKEIEILEPEKLEIDISEKNDATCNSSSDGFVKLKATGGWGEYQFAVEEGDYKNSAYIGQLKAGERQFKVIDKYGIEDSVRVTIGEPDPLRATLVAIDSVSCKGLRDGAVYFDVIGGTAPYRTIYEKETLEGVVVTNLSSDNYNMTFTDSHSCISKDTIHVNIPEPELLEVAKAEVNNTTCELDNGKIALEIQGGSLPYSFEWSENGKEYLNAKNVGVKRSEALELKRNGLYTVTVKDKNGCTTHYERRIATSTNPRVKNVETIDVLCYGSSDGVAIVDSSNVVYGEPRASYHLTWPQGQEGVMSVNTLSAGTYKVRITDENNCTTTTEFAVGTPEPVKNQLVKLRDALCYGYNDGRIETNTIGGVGNYKYVWSTGESTSFADSLKAGQYMVVVADNHECRDTAVYTVAEPEKLTVELGDDALICPGSSYTFDAGEYAKYEWRRESNDSIIETNRQLTTNQGGEYYILVKNEKGCIAQDTIFLGIGEDALVANFLVSSNITISDTIVAIELSNMPVDSIRWEYDETAFIDITADEDESYIKKIRSEKIGTQYITMWAYSGGCMSSDTKQIEVYDIIEEYDSFNLGYDPLIKSVKIAPNPNNGEFFLLVTLREKYDVEVQINDVTTGHVVEKRKLTESDRYEEYINIRTWGSGIYVLSITAGEERRVVKILSVN